MSRMFSITGDGRRAAMLLAGLGLAGLFLGHRVRRAPAPEPTAAAARLSRLPLAFEPNRGQSAAGVRFLARGAGYGLFLKPTEALLGLRRPVAFSRVPGKAGGGPASVSWRPLRIRLLGANPAARMTAEARLPGVSHYFLGNDPSRWQRDVPRFARVRCRQVYPGIDLVYYGNQGELEYDFVVSPGASPAAVRLAVDGAERLELEADGDLVLHADDTAVVQKRPLVYQEIDGQRRAVEGRYLLLARNEIGFQVGNYDPARPLIIDPVLRYSSYLGSSGGATGVEWTTDVVVDSDGGAYVTGMTASANFPVIGPPNAPLPSTLQGPTDAFVAKVNAAGTQLDFSTYVGGSGDENIDTATGNIFGGIALDVSTREIYVTGYTTSANFPLVNPIQVRSGGAGDAFLIKLDASGRNLLFATYLGGSGQDAANGVAVGVAPDTGEVNAYVIGETDSADFPAVNPFQPVYNGGAKDAFLMRINANASAIVYSTFLGGEDEDRGLGIALDDVGNVFCTGFTRSAGFPIRGGFQPTPGGSSDAFVTKFDPVASEVIYSSYLGGSGENVGTGIAVDGAGNAFVVGYTTSTDFPTVMPIKIFRGTVLAYDGGVYSGGISDGFVAKVNPAGDSLIYSSYLGGDGEDVATRVAISVRTPTNLAHLAYVTGFTTSTNFPVSNALRFGAYNAGAPPPDNRDAFITKVLLEGTVQAGGTPIGTGVEYSTYFGGSSRDEGTGIAADSLGRCYAVGITASADFEVRNAFDNNLGGAQDGFVLRISSTPARPDNLAGTPRVIPPTNPSNPSEYVIDLTWRDNADNETGYEVERRLTGTTAFVRVAQLPANAQSYTDRNLSPDTSYTYRVRALNSDGSSAYSNAISVRTLPPPPAPPTLFVFLVSPAGADVQWTDNSTTETGFRVERKKGDASSTEPWVVIRTLPPAPGSGSLVILPRNDLGLDRNTIYTYRVFATGNPSDSLPSNMGSVLTLPADPTNLAVGSASQTEISLTWTDNNPAGTTSLFEVWRSDDGGATFSTIDQSAPGNPGGTVNYQDTGLTPNVEYRYRVRGTNTAPPGVAGGGTSPRFSNTVIAWTRPQPATNLTVNLVPPTTSLRLDWTDNNGSRPSRHRIERSLDNFQANVTVVATTPPGVTSYTDTGIAGNLVYYYRVIAFSPGGDADPTNIQSRLNLPGKPANFTATVPTDLDPVTGERRGRKQVDLTWQDTSGQPSQFIVDMSTDGGATFSPVGSPVSGTAFTVRGLTENTRYCFRVRGVNASGEGENTPVLCVTTLKVPPAAPRALTATVDSSTQITLRWEDASDNEDGFRIQRKSGPNGLYGTIATVRANTTVYRDTGLTPSTTYTYRVIAFNNGGDSPPSREAGGITLRPAPFAPTNLTVTEIRSNRVRLSWTDNSNNETGFKVERSSNGGRTFTQIAVTGTNVATYVDSSVGSNVSYVYRVRATNAGSDSPYSNEVTALTLPGNPTGLVATARSQTEISLRWQDTSTQRAAFRVFRSSDGGVTFPRIAELPVGQTTYDDAGLSPGRTFLYKVRAFNATGESADSNVASATTLPAAPAAPSNLAARTLTSYSIALTWRDNSTNEAGFIVERRVSGGVFQPVRRVGPNTTAITDSGLQAGTTYDYRVKAFNSGGESGYSNEASATTLDSRPAAPTNLRAVLLPPASVRLSWTDNSNNETGFEVERRKGTAAFTVIATVGANVTTFTDDNSGAGLERGTTYTYRVKATNNGGDSAPSNMATITTLPEPPPSPSNLDATAISSTQARVTWSDVTGETGYELERKTGTGDFALLVALRADVTQYIDPGLAPGRTYTYRVVAVNAGGRSAPSNEATVAPLAGPTNLTAVALPGARPGPEIQLTWKDNSEGETAFQIERRDAAGNFTLFRTVPANVTSTVDRTVLAGATYRYRVRAQNATGFSDYSNEASVTAPAPPIGPTNLTATAQSPTSIELAWQDNSLDEAEFRIERKTGTAAFAEIATVAADVTTYTDTGLEPGKTYTYRVRAAGPGGFSVYSNEASATTPMSLRASDGSGALPAGAPPAVPWQPRPRPWWKELLLRI